MVKPFHHVPLVTFGGTAKLSQVIKFRHCVVVSFLSEFFIGEQFTRFRVHHAPIGAGWGCRGGHVGVGV